MRLFSIILVVVLSIILLVYFLFDQSVRDFGRPTYRIIPILSQDKKSTIYIKTKNWGVTGDHQLTVVSTSPEKEFESDSTKEIIFKGLEPFLYKSNKDTLFLYVWEKSIIPENFRSKWIVKQTEIDNSKMMNLRKDNSFNKLSED
ncbi:hypothetical protein [Pedobacter steynii]|uniref:Uncharacterized protein n=1 Tax=Pedobacter steynii TaxID=430522 RepID=A0A1D7QMQ0_9SPHI|nr:hypothetical protein [Pedobacter steynii]AOM79940.1 hypothetical protein BFS30_23915 [Pedobacter steynii]